jgi:hypothetical protein
MHVLVFSWGVVLELVMKSIKAGGRQDTAMKKRAGNLRKLAAAALSTRYVRRYRLSISRECP